MNGIYTGKGGKHVDYILNQLIRKLVAFIKKKKKIDVKPSTIKEQIMLFIRCDINNPSFDSQTKDYMNTPSSAFGSMCDISEKFVLVNLEHILVYFLKHIIAKIFQF